MPVLRMCARHRTLSPGRCPQCVSDRHERRRIHVSARAKRFRAEILVRDAGVCHWCGGEAGTVDYIRAIIDGGNVFDEANAGRLASRATREGVRRSRTAGGVTRAGAPDVGKLHSRGGGAHECVASVLLLPGRGRGVSSPRRKRAPKIYPANFSREKRPISKSAMKREFFESARRISSRRRPTTG